jgi:hypothetical protein
MILLLSFLRFIIPLHRPNYKTEHNDIMIYRKNLESEKLIDIFPYNYLFNWRYLATWIIITLILIGSLLFKQYLIN